MAQGIADADQWLAQHAPANSSGILGLALGNMSDSKFEQAAELALQYNQKFGDDVVLTNFLQSHGARKHRDLALPLLDQIADPVRREAIRNKLDPTKR